MGGGVSKAWNVAWRAGTRIMPSTNIYIYIYIYSQMSWFSWLLVLHNMSHCLDLQGHPTYTTQPQINHQPKILYSGKPSNVTECITNMFNIIYWTSVGGIFLENQMCETKMGDEMLFSTRCHILPRKCHAFKMSRIIR